MGVIPVHFIIKQYLWEFFEKLYFIIVCWSIFKNVYVPGTWKSWILSPLLDKGKWVGKFGNCPILIYLNFILPQRQKFVQLSQMLPNNRKLEIVLHMEWHEKICGKLSVDLYKKIKHFFLNICCKSYHIFYQNIMWTSNWWNKPYSKFLQYSTIPNPSPSPKRTLDRIRA